MDRVRQEWNLGSDLDRGPVCYFLVNKHPSENMSPVTAFSPPKPIPKRLTGEA